MPGYVTSDFWSLERNKVSHKSLVGLVNSKQSKRPLNTLCYCQSVDIDQTLTDVFGGMFDNFVSQDSMFQVNQTGK